ncbi:ISNCY family transposase [Dethiobacter alkaliphilus]
MEEQYKYQVIKKLIEKNGNKKNAALKLGCTTRHINRMIRGYEAEGKAYFLHGNRGRQPVHTLPQETRQLIVDLYLNKYHGSNFTHFCELLRNNESIVASGGTIRTIMMKNKIISPLATRKVKKETRRQLEEEKKKVKTKKELNTIQEKLVDLEDAHPRRPRCAYFGEMIQMDASQDVWFGSDKTYLHLAVDDCTGRIVGAYFDKQETLNGYYNVFHQILTNYGIPHLFYTDRRTVFEYKSKKSPSIEEDTFTQFGYACKRLGVNINTTSVPQAKGRVERMFQTLQSRLPIELRLAGATTPEQANEFLNSYIKEFNALFALPIDYSKSVFETQPSLEDINLTLAVLSKRKIDSGHCIRFDNKYYKPINAQGLPAYYHQGTSCMVIKAFDGMLFTSIGEKVFALDEIPKHEIKSKNFDFPQTVSKPKKRYVPPMSHPWRDNAFTDYVKAQQHYLSETQRAFEDIIYSQEMLY